MLLQNLKNFFVKNKLLSSAFVVLLAVCFFGGLFGLNRLVRETNLYNAYMNEKRTYTVNMPNGAAVDAALSAYISKYKSKTAIIQAEINNKDNPSKELTALCYMYDEMNYPATVGNDIIDINNTTSNKVIILNGNRLEEKIGTIYTINGEEYTVVGVTNFHSGTNTIAYNSLTDKNCVRSIEILLINVLSQKEHEELSETLYELFLGCGIVLPDVSGIKSIWDMSPLLIPIVVLLLLGITNMGYLYAYFLKMRRKQVTIMRICGATQERIILLNLAEIIILIIGMFIIASIAFKVLSPLFYKNSTLPFLYSLNLSHYIMVFSAITAISVLIFLQAIVKSSEINLSECKEE